MCLFVRAYFFNLNGKYHDEERFTDCLPTFITYTKLISEIMFSCLQKKNDNPGQSSTSLDQGLSNNHYI